MSERSSSIPNDSYEGLNVPEQSQVLLGELEALSSDPHGALIAMQEAMQIDIASSIGFHGWPFIKDPESFRNEQLSADQYETIKSFEEIMKVFLKYGSLNPAQQGLWFTVPNEQLNNLTPLDHLCVSAKEGQFDRGAMHDVIHAAVPFLKPEQGGDKALWALWND